MKLSVNHIIAALILCLVSICSFAQEKTLQYYNTHENEILPDARATFRKGDYDRTLELCRWHYIIFGDNTTAEALREKSERCSKLSKEMNDLRLSGNVKSAKQKATVILSINPDDVIAKEVLSIEEPVLIQDTVVVEPPAKTVELLSPPPTETDGKMNEDEILDGQKTERFQPYLGEVSPAPASAQQKQLQAFEPRTRFVIKARATIIDMKQFAQTIAPGGAIGVYDLGGGPVGGEIGAYFCPGLSASSASLFGIDAAIVFRVAKNIYPKFGVGFFSCRSTEADNSSTAGMCAGGGLTYIVRGHLCVEVGLKYYPKVSVQGFEKVTTTPGASYEYPSARQILSGGIAPYVSVGWAF